VKSPLPILLKCDFIWLMGMFAPSEIRMAKNDLYTMEVLEIRRKRNNKIYKKSTAP